MGETDQVIGELGKGMRQIRDKKDQVNGEI